MRNSYWYTILIEKPEENRSVEKRSRRWASNIKTDLKETKYEGV